jgi:hypothetical protein
MPPFEWLDLLTLARQLHGLATSRAAGWPVEAACRSAVSRAYFAAFNYALEYAVTYLDFVPLARVEDRGQDHGRLRAHLQRKRRANAARSLQRLRDYRNACDYERPLPMADVLLLGAEALTLADQVLTALPPPTGPRPQAPAPLP